MLAFEMILFKRRIVCKNIDELICEGSDGMKINKSCETCEFNFGNAGPAPHCE